MKYQLSQSFLSSQSGGAVLLISNYIDIYNRKLIINCIIKIFILHHMMYKPSFLLWFLLFIGYKCQAGQVEVDNI